MTDRTLLPFFALTFGLTWGIAALVIEIATRVGSIRSRDLVSCYPALGRLKPPTTSR